jgi:hypothetical protein
MVATNQNPKWDSVTGKWVSTSSGEENIGPKKPEPVDEPASNYIDPQDDVEVDEDLPF